jgi:hypothetical protein
VIFNDGGVLAGDTKFLWDKTANRLDIDGPLVVTGNLTASSDVLVNGNENYVYLYSTYTIGQNPRARFRAVGAGGGSGYGGDLRISTRASNNNWNTDVLTVDSTGKVGIRTVTPAVDLTVRTTHAVATATTYTGGLLIHDEPNGIASHFNAGIAYDGGNQHSWIQSNSSTGVLPLALNPAGGDVRIGANLVMLTANKGIDFSINSNAGGATSELLNDYEEGTFAPTVTSEFGTIGTTTVNAANYTKIGRVVTINFDISISTVGTGSGSLLVTLPFNSAVESGGAGRESSNTGNMCQVFRQSATTIAVRFYNNLTPIVALNRLLCGYTYNV